jgi:hypothetical protein
MLFIDYSLTFNTIGPFKLNTTLRALGLDTKLRALGLDTKLRAPGLDTKLRAPGLDTKLRALGLDTKLRAPGLDTKLRALGLDTKLRVLCNWIQDFLTGRTQAASIGNRTSSTLILNTGAPQGCVLSPLLYSLFTHN